MIEMSQEIPSKPSGLILSLMRAFYRQHTEAATVSSDDFRNQGLDKYLKHRNGIGFFFACLKRWKYGTPVGRIRSTYPSTHGRLINQFTFTDKGKMELK